MSADLEAVDVYYHCQRCTNCCRWPGFVAISDEDVTRISGFLKMTEAEFIKQHTQLRPQRNGLALKDRDEGHACLFLEGRDCTIQSVKPSQCAGFPNSWNFPGWQDVCEAIAIPITDCIAEENTTQEEP